MSDLTSSFDESMIDGETNIERKVNGQNSNANFVVQHLAVVEDDVGNVGAE